MGSQKRFAAESGRPVAHLRVSGLELKATNLVVAKQHFLANLNPANLEDDFYLSCLTNSVDIFAYESSTLAMFMLYNPVWAV